MEPKADNQKDILTRLRKIEGQVRGVQRMVESESECNEILNQIAAIRAAVNKVGIMVFEYHAYECLINALDEQSNSEAFQEIISTMSRLIK